MKVAVVIITYNVSSEIFILQIEAIKKFCKDDFAIHIIDNSDNEQVAVDIKYHAENFGLEYVKTFSSSKNGSDSHSWAANFAYQLIKDRYSYFCFFDHDLIPVIPFSVVSILNGGHVIAGVGQLGSTENKIYFWPGCVMFHLEGDERNIIDFSPSVGLDTGGGLNRVVEHYGKEYCVFFNEAYYQNPYFNSNVHSSYAMLNNNMFMHFINASNWSGKDRHEERINTLLNIAREKIYAADSNDIHNLVERESDDNVDTAD